MVVRTDRELYLYQKYFGPDLGMQPELILDVGAGDADAGFLCASPGRVSLRNLRRLRKH